MNINSIIAHRGASFYAPENTLASMRRAHAMGAQWVEFDVMLTSDGELIVFHDDTLERTTDGGKRNVADTPLAKIRELDAGSWFAPQFKGEPVPPFVELLTL
ncbi:MAG: glycerophosphoryl diester phosphodiesterase, partial [Pseudomonadota bacterium]|nr:glycerophosphoryl diester phosphodiesterase [Pseudomonadota bacterium]